ncbi:hypothetical protein QL285_068127 [Trifolium repens]|nr:hypothetical protein QL285_068127 [Trifolium repens]
MVQSAKQQAHLAPSAARARLVPHYVLLPQPGQEHEENVLQMPIEGVGAKYNPTLPRERSWVWSNRPLTPLYRGEVIGSWELARTAP